jgi:peptide/nickel transport system substrate-binding protein
VEPAALDPRVRTALYHAIDREAISDAVNGGNPQLAAWSILPSTDPLYSETRDTLRQFSYDPERSKAGLRDSGWIEGADGALHNDADGRSFRTAIWASLGTDAEIAAYASYWRKIGLDVDEHVSSAAESRDPAARAQFPGFEISSVDIPALLAHSAASVETRWSGNRNGYEDPQAQQIANAYFASLTPTDQLGAMRAINEFYINQMLGLPTFFQATYVIARKGVTAFDDFAGGSNNEFYGSFYRNSNLWDVE